MQTPKEFLTRNWVAKLFSIALATVLWMTISSQANSEIGVVIPIEYRNIPTHLEVVGETTNTVEVRLKGSAALIREISAKDISATLDLGQLQPGEKIVQLTQQNVRAPFGIEIVRVNPSQVRLHLEKTMSKTVPVVVALAGEPAAGWLVQATTVAPEMVEIQGPESKVSSIESVRTSQVKLAGRNASFTEAADLDLPVSMVRLQYLSPVEVRVQLRERGSKQ